MSSLFQPTGIDVTKNFRAFGKLKREVEKMQHTFNSLHSGSCSSLGYIFAGSAYSYSHSYTTSYSTRPFPSYHVIFNATETRAHYDEGTITSIQHSYYWQVIGVFFAPSPPRRSSRIPLRSISSNKSTPPEDTIVFSLHLHLVIQHLLLDNAFPPLLQFRCPMR
ncbi:hypothetical protein BT96DRAFT_999110 [Gymnopus androsaceus JB14]|uniref:Uncharacterized protein n=1 Tax=Gymnopus androsaceus JB14 TaxID=1447944 RepID=A0A6A4H9I8_9AGAR|nr:hypothetical protein BT96DRAFT_999110 [Gymnopus androsaceus JB14]